MGKKYVICITNDQKDFWKILNRIKSRKDTQQPALDDFYDYFKKINMVDQEELDDFEIPIPGPMIAMKFLTNL